MRFWRKKRDWRADVAARRDFYMVNGFSKRAPDPEDVEREAAKIVKLERTSKWSPLNR